MPFFPTKNEMKLFHDDLAWFDCYHLYYSFQIFQHYWMHFQALPFSFMKRDNYFFIYRIIVFFFTPQELFFLRFLKFSWQIVDFSQLNGRIFLLYFDCHIYLVSLLSPNVYSLHIQFIFNCHIFSTSFSLSHD